VGTTKSGSLSLAQTPERMVELDYVHSMARHHDLPVERLDPSGIAHAVPLLETVDLVAACCSPATPPSTRRGHLRDRHGGLRPRRTHRRRHPRHRLSPGGRPVTGVQTTKASWMRGGSDRRWPVVARRGPHGRHTRTAAGGPARLGADDGRRRRTRDLPIVRDLDGHFYARHYRGGLVIGAFAPGAKARRTSSIPPDFAFAEFEPDREHMDRPLAAARCRIPALRDAGLEHFLNAPESFTPDAVFLMGETAEVEGLWVAAGSTRRASSSARASADPWPHG